MEDLAVGRARHTPPSLLAFAGGWQRKCQALLEHRQPRSRETEAQHDGLAQWPAEMANGSWPLEWSPPALSTCCPRGGSWWTHTYAEQALRLWMG